MTAPIITLADAIVTALNAATLSQAFTAERIYAPKFDLASGEAVQIKVAPKSDVRQPGSAAADNATIQIELGIFKKLGEDTTSDIAEMDAMLAFCEEIKPLINRQRLAAGLDAICTGTAQETPYFIDALETERVFLTLITATFAVEVSL
jgi:hypothetical protein